MLWAFVSCLTVPVLIRMTGFVSDNLMVHLMVISLLHFMVRIHQNWLLAKEKIIAFNVIAVIHPVAMSLLLVVFFVVMKWHTVAAFVAAYYATTVLSLLASSVYMIKNKALRFSWNIRQSLRASFRLGYVIQAGNLLQLLNYRFAFYLLQNFYGKFQVGLYSMAVAFAESSWMIANSFATIQYARISNSVDDVSNVRVTVTFLRMALWLTLIPVAVLLALPAGFFRYFLSQEFAQLPQIIPWLAPGILFVVVSITISHYYSGSGNPKIGFIGSAVGFAVTMALGFYLVSTYGITGAALTATLSYGASAATVLYFFTRKNKLTLKDFMPTRKDIEFLKALGKQPGSMG